MAPSVVPKKEELELKPTSVRLPQDLVDDIAKVVAETRQSRNEVIVYLLRHALDVHFGRKPKK